MPDRSELWLFDHNDKHNPLPWLLAYDPRRRADSVVTRTPLLITFQGQGTNPWRARAGVAAWSPELSLNRTLRATLTENGSPVLSNVTLANGTTRVFANGTLIFRDADGDGYLSTEDFFTLQGKLGEPLRALCMASIQLSEECARGLIARPRRDRDARPLKGYSQGL